MREVFQRLKQAILEKQDTMLLTIGTSQDLHHEVKGLECWFPPKVE